MIDAHCHLDDERFARDLDAVIARAQEAGVTAILTAGVDVASSRAAVALAERYDAVYAVVGIHPHYAAAYDDNARAEIRALAAHRKVVGIGEIGLDFHYTDRAPRAMQERGLGAQLDLAEELGKSVVIHDRDAHAALRAILQSRRGKPRGILHCFSGDLAMAREAIALGYLISFAGNVTFKNAPRLQAIAAALPLDYIVIETDAPYLSPLRGRRNEPANVRHVATKIAELKRLEPATVAQTTTDNLERLFGFPSGK